MNRWVKRLPELTLGFAASIALACTIGCGGKDSVARPKVDPEKVADELLTLADSDGNGNISADEVGAVPYYRQAIAEERDKSLDRMQLIERIRSYYETATVMTGITCHVTLNGRPLEGATVTFDPPECIASSVEPAIGTTNAGGISRPMQPGVPAAYLGPYLVRISKVENGEETIPQRYNSATELGAELIIQDQSVKTEFAFSLKSS